MVNVVWFSGWCILLAVVQVAAKRDRTLYCGACMALVDEMLYAIEQVDHRKMIEVGSYRINPDGTQSQEKVPYAGSEVHLVELIEEVCEKMKEYAKSTDPESQKETYVRYNQRKEEDGLELKNISIDGETAKRLEYACNEVIENHEEDLIELFKEKKDNIAHVLCTEITDLCSDDEEHDEL